MEEIVTVDGKQFRLTTDRPLTALERQQTIEQIKQQTGCSTCHQPRTMSDYSGIYSMADSCRTAPYSEGSTVSLVAGPLGGTGPYNVRFWRKPNASGGMTYSELGTTQTCAEGATVGTSFVLYDTDFVAASGQSTATIPITSTSGAISEGSTTVSLAAGKIRVATTIYDSCPTTPQTCVTYCDINLVCAAPTCNFVVS